MAHIEERELLELAQGPRPSGRRDEVEAHLSQCAECRRRFDDLQDTCRLLDEWRLAAPERDLWPAIEARVRRNGRRIILWPGAKTALRIAATILLALGIGHGSGRWARHKWRQPESFEALAVQIDEGAVGEWLHLSALGQSLPSGLTEAVLDAAASNGEEAL